MSGFARLTDNMTDHVFEYRHQPRVANVWSRAASRTAYLFDKADASEESHGVADTQNEAETDAAAVAGTAAAIGESTAAGMAEEEAVDEEEEIAQAKISEGNCCGEGEGCACNEFGCGCGCCGGEVEA
ncbi:MAG: hypothetical protein QF437_09735 [Planctomycetota bacterium]|jgi:hypothetical protein|nr:hypothetical protein [Planctomycetota bacterium]MDP7130760.1 hypothetical protein [Planctomycetota bacterium]MDP7248107.1 hypothetical protein [Planctomycetota bacterium]